jgi:hypothetical protein
MLECISLNPTRSLLVWSRGGADDLERESEGPFPRIAPDMVGGSFANTDTGTIPLLLGTDTVCVSACVVVDGDGESVTSLKTSTIHSYHTLRLSVWRYMLTTISALSGIVSGV